jgi:glutamate carboxypeptidase
MAMTWQALLEAVCTIDSRTGPGAAGTVQVSQLLGDQLREMGFDLQWSDPLPKEGPRGRHLVAVRSGRSAGRRIVLLGHSDTILSPQEAPYRGPDADGRVHGSGVCDMKGGCVVLVECLRQMQGDPAASDAQWVVLINCAEETSSASFHDLARQWTRGAAACLCFEPSRILAGGEQEVVIGRKGVIRFDLRCTGRSAHAGNDHHLGVNAVRELGRKIEPIESLTNPALDLTANVGVIRGGVAANVVPQHAEMSFELRAFDPAVLEAACVQARQWCGESTVRNSTGQGTTLTHDEVLMFRPWPVTAASQALADRYVQLAAGEGLIARAGRRGGGSDACSVADLAPTLDGLGPVGGGMHASTEWADIRTLPERVRAAASLLRELAAGELDATLRTVALSQ